MSDTPLSPAAARGPTRPGRPAVLDRDVMGGLEKGLAVIECFGVERPRLTISEVARRTGLSRAAARRCLLTLMHLGYARQDERHFLLTPKVMRLGQSYLYSARLPRALQPQLQKIAMAMQEASSAGVLDGDDVISVAAATAGRVVSSTLQPGTRVPAYCTANGRVLVAWLPAPERDAWLARQDLRALTPRTLTDAASLRDELARVRAQGYALVDQEYEPGLRTVAVPLRNRLGDIECAMNVSVHAARVPIDELLDRCLPVLLQAQEELKPLF
ncbi:IclR family transcriptional regulator domain-containing protein [Sphaerotilus hippei]